MVRHRSVGRRIDCLRGLAGLGRPDQAEKKSGLLSTPRTTSATGGHPGPVKQAPGSNAKPTPLERPFEAAPRTTY